MAAKAGPTGGVSRRIFRRLIWKYPTPEPPALRPAFPNTGGGPVSRTTLSACSPAIVWGGSGQARWAGGIVRQSEGSRRAPLAGAASPCKNAAFFTGMSNGGAVAEQDSGYKLLFSHPEMIEDLIRGFVREDWVRDLDFSTLEKVPGNYVAPNLMPRESDVVW